MLLRSYFTTERSGTENLLREGISSDKIHFVGNSMIDSLRSHIDKALTNRSWQRFGLKAVCYGLVTLHRPANVDDKAAFLEVGTALMEISRQVPLIFPVHPRTRQRIEQFGINLGAVILAEPLDYLDFLGLMAKASLVLTDSGGIQEETTALGVPCVTIRLNTERPATIELGTNQLAGIKKTGIVNFAHEALCRNRVTPSLPPMWDGQAACRIVDAIESFLDQQGDGSIAGTQIFD